MPIIKSRGPGPTHTLPIFLAVQTRPVATSPIVWLLNPPSTVHLDFVGEQFESDLLRRGGEIPKGRYDGRPLNISGIV